MSRKPRQLYPACYQNVSEESNAVCLTLADTSIPLKSLDAQGFSGKFQASEAHRFAHLRVNEINHLGGCFERGAR